MAHTTRMADASGGRPAGHPPRSGASRPLDASMVLLREVMERPLDPGYAAAAARKRERGTGPSRGALVVTLLIAVLCGWVAMRAVTELRRPQPEVLDLRTQLVRQIEQRTEHADALQSTNEKLRSQIAAAQSATLETQGDSAMAEQSRRLALVSGEVPVTGPGLEITLNDAPDSRPTDGGTDPREDAQAEQGRVLDRDIQLVVNGLWSAGAEAIAINGQRLSALSAIRSAGAAVLVDYRPLAPPYVIRAVGDPQALQTGFAANMAGPYLQSLRDNYGVQAAIEPQSVLALPGAGSIVLRSATVPGAIGATGSPGPAPSGRPSTSSKEATP